MNKIEKTTLTNGLTIYFYEDKRKHTTIFQVITFFGGMSKDYKIDNVDYHFSDGIAHILEHYLVECNKYGNYIEILGQHDMNSNACTQGKITRFFFDTVDNIEFGIKTLLNCIYSPVFTEENLNKLKEPIYQEIRGKENNKFYHEDIKVLNNCFHSLSFKTTGGTIEEVKNISLEEIKLCYEAFYQPSNQIIIVAGNFNKEQVLKTIKEETKTIKIPKHKVEKINIKEKKEVVKQEDELLFPTPKTYTEVTYKISLDHLSNLEQLKLDFYIYYFMEMTTSVSSPLYKKVIKDKIITGSINKSKKQLENYLLLSIGSYTDKKEELVNSIIEEFKNPTLDKELFEIDKKNTILEIILREENLSSMISPLIGNIVDFNYPYPDTIEDIEKFSFEEFKKLIQSLDFTNYTVTTIKNPKN